MDRGDPVLCSPQQQSFSWEVSITKKTHTYKRTINYLIRAEWPVHGPVEIVLTVWNSKSCNPLFSIVSSLGANLWHLNRTKEIDLKPLVVIIVSRYPRTDIGTTLLLPQSSERSYCVLVLDWRYCDLFILNASALESKCAVAEGCCLKMMTKIKMTIMVMMAKTKT